MTKEEAYRYIDNLKWLKGYDNTTIDGKTVSEILDEIKTLLKEEAAEVVEEERRVLWDETDDGPVYTHDVFYHCPSCNLILSRTHKDKDINFCENCGQAVKWDD